MERDIELLKYLPRWIVNKALKRWPGPPITPQSALDILYKNPYQLIQLPGVGFKRADKAACDSGVAATDPRRYDAALTFVLAQGCFSEGHSWLSLDQAARWAQEERIDGVAYRQLSEACERMKASGMLKEWNGLITLSVLAKAEHTIAQTAHQISQDIECENLVNLDEEYGLNPEQSEAVRIAQTKRFLILTGGARNREDLRPPSHLESAGVAI